MIVHLHIERLVLDSLMLAPGQQRLLQLAVQAELTRLLGAGGLRPELMEGAAAASLAGPALTLSSGSGTLEAGGKIAASVYASVGKAAPMPQSSAMHSPPEGASQP
jgi:hypothetical protein